MRTYWLFYALLFMFMSTVVVSEPRTVVRIGIIMPLSGEQAVYGIDALKVFKQIEEKLKNNYQYDYHLIFEDGKCGVGKDASIAAKKLINIDKVKFLVAGCSGEILQVGPIAEKAKVVTTCFACGHPDISKVGDYIFRVFVNLSQGTKLVADSILAENQEPIAVLTEESSFTEGIKNELEIYLKDKEVFYEDFSESEVDFRSLLARLLVKKPKIIYLNLAVPKTYQLLVKQMKSMKIDSKFYAYHHPADQNVIKALGDMQRGVRYLATPEINIKDYWYSDFYSGFLKKYPEGVENDFLIKTSHDSLMLIIKAIEEVGTNSQQVKDYIANKTYQGALGQISFNSDGDLQGVSYQIKEVN